MANYIARGASVAAGGYGPTGSLKRTYPGQPQPQALHVINPDCELHNRQLSKSIPNFNQFIMSPQQQPVRPFQQPPGGYGTYQGHPLPPSSPYIMTSSGGPMPPHHQQPPNRPQPGPHETMRSRSA